MLLNGFCNDAARSEFTPSLVGHSGTPWSRLAHAVRTLVHLPVTAEVGDGSGRQLPTLAPRSEAGDSRLCHPRPSPARPDPVSCTGYALSGAQGLGGVTPQGILGETRLHISAAGAALLPRTDLPSHSGSAGSRKSDTAGSVGSATANTHLPWDEEARQTLPILVPRSSHCEEDTERRGGELSSVFLCSDNVFQAVVGKTAAAQSWG